MAVDRQAQQLMPRALSRCAEPGCPQLVKAGRCAEHAARTWRYITDRRWRALSSAYRKLHPSCQTPGCTRPSEHVHHRDGLGLRGPRAYDPANLRALCRGCHAHLHGARGAA